MEPLPTTREGADARVRVGWELLHLLQLSVRSLEDTATRVAPGQIAGLIALWTQLYTFEERVPHALAWLAWGLLLAAVAVLAGRITPRRLRAFWGKLDACADERCREPMDEAAEVAIVDDLTQSLRVQRDVLERGLRFSIWLGISGLGVAAVAYLVDKGLYAP